jgi:hypothetical protein
MTSEPRPTSTCLNNVVTEYGIDSFLRTLLKYHRTKLVYESLVLLVKLVWSRRPRCRQGLSTAETPWQGDSFAADASLRPRYPLRLFIGGPTSPSSKTARLLCSFGRLYAWGPLPIGLCGCSEQKCLPCRSLISSAKISRRPSRYRAVVISSPYRNP